MNTPVPGPSEVDPGSLRAEVDDVLGSDGAAGVDQLDADGLAEAAQALDSLHRSLAAALDTIDRV